MPDQRTKAERGTVGDGIIGHGPFDEGIHSTPAVLWIGVVIICLGSIVAGFGITALHWGTDNDLWVMVAVGSLLSLVGVVLLFANDVMSNVD